MKTKLVLLLLTFVLLSHYSFPQNRQFKVHERGMLHQTVYNTGEVGRPYDAGQGGIIDGVPPSMEWPPNSRMIIDRKLYSGQHNSMGGGFHMAATKNGTRVIDYCGAVSDANGKAVDIEGIYTMPGTVERFENYPIKKDGTVNAAFNPNEAEEIIVSKWTGVKTGLTVTRTSRAWSFPGYDQFIIYEYEISNPTTDTLSDVFLAWTYSLSPSMFGYERKFNKWSEGSYRNNQFARFDLKRWLSYNVDINGKPDTTNLFDLWSQEGERGGLNSPQAVGIMVLHYDYDNLITKANTKLFVAPADTSYVWDENNKINQPYLCRYENGNLYEVKIGTFYDISARKTGPFKGSADSNNYADNLFWMGRVKPAFKLGFAQPVTHAYGFGPYLLAPGAVAKFTVAEVVGYGAGVAADSIYKDLGGSTQASLETGSGMHPVQSWYTALSYPEAYGPVGSNYLQTHPLPWYVHSDVVSIRDVADRAIQMYTGNTLTNYSSLPTGQFDPKLTPAHGVYNVGIQAPAPLISIDTLANPVITIKWGTAAESFLAPGLHAPLKSYIILRAPHPLGPWAEIATIQRKQTGYFFDSLYVFKDSLNYLSLMYYAVVSVDSLGGRSGMTNMTLIERTLTGTDKYVLPESPALLRNYPNPFNPSTIIAFSLGKASNVTLDVFDIMGRRVAELFCGYKPAGNFSIAWNPQMSGDRNIASGVYFVRLHTLTETKMLKVLYMK